MTRIRLSAILLAVFMLILGPAEAQVPVKPPAIVGAYCTQAFVNNGTRVGFNITGVDANGIVSGYIGGRGNEAWVQHFGSGADATYRNETLEIRFRATSGIYVLKREGRLFVGTLYRQNTGWRGRVVFNPNDRSCRKRATDPA